mgnify:CR=1 FL=1
MKDSEPKTKYRTARAILIAVAIVTLALPFLYVGAVTVGLRAHMDYDCRLQLRNLGVALREHAEVHGGHMPNRWSEMTWVGIEDVEKTSWPRLFVCPAVGHEPGTWSQVDLWSDYHLIPGCTTNDPAGTVLAIEPLSNHKKGVNVLFVNGSTAWWPASNLLQEPATAPRAR